MQKQHLIYSLALGPHFAVRRVVAGTILAAVVGIGVVCLVL
jgi:uncharacterized membrane protein YraQ (UPF0718 family)